jgi:hypothetical protein
MLCLVTVSDELVIKADERPSGKTGPAAAARR